MLFLRPTFQLETERMILRLPRRADHADWARLRREGELFLRRWEPRWSADHLSRAAFKARVAWAEQGLQSGRALSLFLTRRGDGALMGAITLDNIRRGPAQMGHIGYWIGPEHARQGYMTEAMARVIDHAFGALDLSRIEAACLPENTASRRLLARSGFVEEGQAEAYLQIDGRWRTHVLYALLRDDRHDLTGGQTA